MRPPIKFAISQIMAAGLTALMALPAAAAQDTGAAFLKIGVGARPLAMGSAFSAQADDVSAIGWNPAGLGRLKQAELSATHTEWLSDLRYDFLGAALPTRFGTMAVSARRLSQAGMERRDASGAQDGSFGAADTAATFSLARSLSPRYSAGMNVTYVQQQIDTAKATGLAMDFGAQAKVSSRLSLGAAVQNLGSSMKFINESFKLPLTVSGGASVLALKGFTVGADIRHEVYAGKTSFNLGTEYVAFDSLALRAGYETFLQGAKTVSSSNLGSGSVDRLAGLGFGMGLKIARYNLDYAFLPHGDLDATHHITLSAKF